MVTLIRRFKKFIPILIFLFIWEIAAKLQLVNNLFIPPFSEVLIAILDLMASGILPLHIMLSFIRALLGLLIAIGVSIPLGLVLAGLNKKIQIAVEPVIEFFSQVNPFVLFHVIILAIGIDEASKITIIAWTCIWPIVFSTAAGVKNIDPILLKAAKGLGAKGFQIAVKVLIPAAAPAIFTGLRLSAGYSLFMLIAAEMMGASSGLGWLIINSQENYSIKTIFAAVTVIALISLLIDILMEKLEKKFAYYEKVEGEKVSIELLEDEGV